MKAPRTRPKKPGLAIAAAEIDRASLAACRRFNLRELQLCYRANADRPSRWHAVGLIEFHAITAKIRDDGAAPPEGATYEVAERWRDALVDRPVAQGEGATQIDAIAALAAVSWARRTP